MASNMLTGDTRIEGNLTATSMTIPDSSVTNSTVSASAAISRSKLAQDALAEHVIPWESWREHDAINTNIPATSSGSYIGLYGGTFGSATPYLGTGDVKASTITRYARMQYALPPWYDAGQTIYVRVYGGMITTVADDTATVDIECYKGDGKAGLGADLCTTAAQSINSVTFANKDFIITPTGLTSGDILDIRITLYVKDSGTMTAVIGAAGKVSMLLDIRG